MNKKISLIALVSIIAFSATSFANEANEDVTAKCKEYAAEDNIPAAEMKEYMAQCIEDMTAPAETTEESPKAE